jgi:hypothetical protein
MQEFSTFILKQFEFGHGRLILNFAPLSTPQTMLSLSPGITHAKIHIRTHRTRTYKFCEIQCVCYVCLLAGEKRKVDFTAWIWKYNLRPSTPLRPSSEIHAQHSARKRVAWPAAACLRYCVGGSAGPPARKCAAGCITNARAAGPKRYGPTNDGVHASFHKSRCGPHAAAQSFTLCANQLGTRTNNALPLRIFWADLLCSCGKNSLSRHAIFICYSGANFP